MGDIEYVKLRNKALLIWQTLKKEGKYIDLLVIERILKLYEEYN